MQDAYTKLLVNPHSSEKVTEVQNNEVQNEFKRSYKNLYTKQSLKTEKDCFEYVSKLHIPKLSDSDRTICEGKLTLNPISTGGGVSKCNPANGSKLQNKTSHYLETGEVSQIGISKILNFIH